MSWRWWLTLSLDFLLCHVALGLEMGLCDRCWEGAGPGAQGADGPRRSLRLDDGPLGESDESYKPLSEMHPLHVYVQFHAPSVSLT